MKLHDFFKQYQIVSLNDLTQRIKDLGNELPIELVYQAAEYLNPNRDLQAAYYTDKHICEYIMSELPEFENKVILKILEPSVGVGRFILFLAEKYKEKIN